MQLRRKLYHLLIIFLCVNILEVNSNDLSDEGKHSKSKGYVVMGVKLGLNHLDIETRDRIDLVGQSQGIQLSIGQEILPILSIELSANLWLSNNGDDEDSSEHELIHDFHFSGASLGVNTLVYFSQKNGPYGKFGFHCWGGTGYSKFVLWGDVGCSKLVGGGFVTGEKFYEVTHIRFHEVNSWLFTMGYRI